MTLDLLPCPFCGRPAHDFGGMAGCSAQTLQECPISVYSFRYEWWNLRAPVVPLPSENRYGVDVAYFRSELSKLADSLMDRPADELARYLQTLADAAKPESHDENCFLAMGGGGLCNCSLSKGDKEGKAI